MVEDNSTSNRKLYYLTSQGGTKKNKVTLIVAYALPINEVIGVCERPVSDI